MKELIMKDVDDEVVIQVSNRNGETKEVSGIISMIAVLRRGIKYRAKFEDGYQRSFSQKDIIR